MKNVVLLLFLAVSSVAFSQVEQREFETCVKKEIFFTTNLEKVDFIIVATANELREVAVIHNRAWENPVWFSQPGEYIAVGVSVNSENTIEIVTNPTVFSVSDNTQDLSEIKIN
jgi:hypothetical protein